MRVGHFPNVTHVQALVARNFERQGRTWFGERLGPNVKVEWYAYNAGPSAMEAIFANAIDLTYVGPSPALNAYARSRGEEVRIVAGAVNGGAGLVVQPDSGLAKASDFKGKRIATPQFGNTQDVAARAWLVAGGLRITQTGGDAQVVPTANPDQLALFRSKQLDAVWTVEPWVAAPGAGGGRARARRGKGCGHDGACVQREIPCAKTRSRPPLRRRPSRVDRLDPAEPGRSPAHGRRGVEGRVPGRAAARGRRARLGAAWRSRPMFRCRRSRPTSRSAQQVGFLRGTPDLARLVETSE